MRVEATAQNGPEALAKIEEIHPDILITDIRMPGLNGLELIRRVREKVPELEIIIISGYAHFEYAQNAMALGVHNYILKPIKQDELCGALQSVVRHIREKRGRDYAGDAEQAGTVRDRESLKRQLMLTLQGDATGLTAGMLQ